MHMYDDHNYYVVSQGISTVYGIMIVSDQLAVADPVHFSHGYGYLYSYMGK